MVSLEAMRVQFNVVDESILQHLYKDCVDVSDARRCSCALILAAHIFMCVTLRQMPSKHPLVRRMCIRLQSAVGMTPSAREIWTDNRAALLWIAFIGLLGTGEMTESCPEGRWFLNLFQSTVQEYLQDFPLSTGSIRRILSAFLWDESYCQPVINGLEECWVHSLI
jgi:hypothetical protein